MNEENKEQRRKCFIITPIGNENSEIFRKAKGVIDSVIKPVLEKYDFDDIKPAYEILESGMISNQIINRIVNDDLVIANLTGNNPNVMYELSIRHATAKPIIHICENGTVLPFDIKDSRTIFYKDDMLGVQELNMAFEKFVSQIDYSKEYKDNPIYSAVKINILLHNMNNEGRQTEADLLRTILSEISSLKIRYEDSGETKLNKNGLYPYSYINDKDAGFYEILIQIFDIKKETLLELSKSFTKAISVMEIFEENNNMFIKIMNTPMCYEYQLQYLIEDELKTNGIYKYIIKNIERIY